MLDSKEESVSLNELSKDRLSLDDSVISFDDSLAVEEEEEQEARSNMLEAVRSNPL